MPVRFMGCPVDDFQFSFHHFDESEESIITLCIDAGIDDTDQGQPEEEGRSQDRGVLYVVGHHITQSDGSETDKCKVERTGSVDS